MPVVGPNAFPKIHPLHTFEVKSRAVTKRCNPSHLLWVSSVDITPDEDVVCCCVTLAHVIRLCTRM